MIVGVHHATTCSHFTLGLSCLCWSSRSELPTTSQAVLFIMLATLICTGAVLVAAPNNATAYSHDIHSMVCVAFGNPMPQISWSKSGSTINPQNMPTFYVNNTSVMAADGTQFFVSIFTFCALRLSDTGTYSCNVQSAANDQYLFLNGMQSATFSLSVTVKRK